MEIFQYFFNVYFFKYHSKKITNKQTKLIHMHIKPTLRSLSAPDWSDFPLHLICEYVHHIVVIRFSKMYHKQMFGI